MRKLPLFLSAALLLAGTARMQADQVTLTTGVPVGQNLTLGLNADLKVTLQWGNGATQDITSDGSLISVPVLDAGLTISSTIGNITALYVQGNKLSALDVTQAPRLKQLLCADNELSTVDLSKCTQLEQVDVQGNQLSSLSASASNSMDDMNVAANKLKSLPLSSSARLKWLVANDNALSALPSSTIMKEAETVWASNNALSTATLSSSSNLKSVVLENNKLTRISLAEAPALTDVWVDHNELTTLDLSKGSPVLYALSAAHNKLKSVLWDTDSKKTCAYAYLNDNALFINSMPSLSTTAHPITTALEPQSAFEITDSHWKTGEYIDLADFVSKNGWGVTNSPTVTFTDRNGYVLKSGTDFSKTGQKYKFSKEFAAVTMTVTSSKYPNMTFTTKPFNIGDITGIHAVTDGAAQDGRVLTSRGSLQWQGEHASRVRIFNAAGMQVVDATVQPGSHTWQLPTGVYVVNGKKVVVP